MVRLQILQKGKLPLDLGQFLPFNLDLREPSGKARLVKNRFRVSERERTKSEQDREGRPFPRAGPQQAFAARGSIELPAPGQVGQMLQRRFSRRHS